MSTSTLLTVNQSKVEVSFVEMSELNKRIEEALAAHAQKKIMLEKRQVPSTNIPKPVTSRISWEWDSGFDSMFLLTVCILSTFYYLIFRIPCW